MGSEAFTAARDFLLEHREDYDTAYRDFRWPQLDRFNWALDWFDAELARGQTAGRNALAIVDEGTAANRDAALSIFRHIRERLAPYKRVLRLEFADLPKTISGKIRRVELRREEEARATEGHRAANEFREEDFPELHLHSGR